MADGVGLVPVRFPVSPTLHSLDPAYFTPTYCKNTLFLSDLKFYSVFLGSSHEALSLCTSLDSQGHTFSVKKIVKNNLGYINFWFTLRVTPSSFPKHHEHDLQPQCSIHPPELWTCFPSEYSKMAKLGIYTGLPKSIPKLSQS